MRCSEHNYSSDNPLNRVSHLPFSQGFLCRTHQETSKNPLTSLFKQNGTIVKTHVYFIRNLILTSKILSDLTVPLRLSPSPGAIPRRRIHSSFYPTEGVEDYPVSQLLILFFFYHLYLFSFCFPAILS